MGKFVAFIIALVIVVGLGLSCFTSVPAGFTGVHVTFGKVADYTLDSGIHAKAPWTKVIKMDNRIQKHTVTMSAFSKDIQETSVVYTINYQISKNDAMTIYRTIGNNILIQSLRLILVKQLKQQQLIILLKDLLTIVINLRVKLKKFLLVY